jgi:hypothetical protein
MGANRITDEVFENQSATEVDVTYSTCKEKRKEYEYTFFFPYQVYDFIFPADFFEILDNNNI